MSPLPTTKELSQLKAIKGPACLSIYLKSNSLDQRNALAIELKNNLQQAKKILADHGLNQKRIKKITGPIDELIQLNKYWPKLGYNIAIFAGANFFQYFYIRDNSFENQIFLADTFELKPLIRILNSNREYYILELGHQDVKLLKGDNYSLEEVDLNGLPHEMMRDLHLDEFPKSRQSHTIAPVKLKDSEAFHEQYNVKQTDKLFLKEFFRLIDHNLHRFLFYRQKPLILAGVSYLIPIYKGVNSYPKLMDKFIGGNQTFTNTNQLRNAALKILS